MNYLAGAFGVGSDFVVSLDRRSPLTVRVAWLGGDVVEYSGLHPDRYYVIEQAGARLSAKRKT